jgi:dipeptide/tripeptide permease
MFALAAVVKTVGVNLAKPALQAASVKAVTPDKRGAAVSTYYIGTDLGQGTAPMISGKIVDMNGGDYSMLFMLFALPLALSGAAYYWITRHVQKKASAKEAG